MRKEDVTDQVAVLRPATERYSAFVSPRSQAKRKSRNFAFRTVCHTPLLCFYVTVQWRLLCSFRL